MSIAEHSGGPRATIVDAAGVHETISYINWPAIFAGAVLASAISFILLTFGSAIGLSMTSAEEGQSISLFWIAIVGGLWILWVHITASLAGGYLVGRMRPRVGDATEYESDIRDGSNGLVMWALATLIAAAIAWSGVVGAANVAGRVAGEAASVTAQAADAIDPTTMLVDRTLRGGPGAPALSQSDRDAVMRIFVSAATSEDGIDAADRDYLVATVAERAGIPPEEAQARIDQVVAQAQQLEADARAAAEKARHASIIAAFLTAAALAVGAVAAYYAATLGGNHRDKQTVVEGWYKRW